MSKQKIQVGQTVLWYSSLEKNAKPYPATVMSADPNGTLALNVHQPNRLMYRTPVFNRTDPQLTKYTRGDLEMIGCWLTYEQAEEWDLELEKQRAAEVAANAERVRLAEKERLEREQASKNPKQPTAKATA